jgi:hypothetical protein
MDCVSSGYHHTLLIYRGAGGAKMTIRHLLPKVLAASQVGFN